MDEETSNKVLETKIDGLSKLTDERFLNIKETLLRIENNNQTFASKTELEEVKKEFNSAVKRIEEAFVRHNSEDAASFGGLSKQMSFLVKAIFIGMGGLGVISFFLPFLIQYLYK